MGIREVFKKTKELTPDVRPTHYLSSPGVYSNLAGMTDGVEFEVMSSKEAAMVRQNELGAEGKKACILATDQAVIYAPQSNGMVRIGLVWMDGTEAKFKYLGDDGKGGGIEIDPKVAR